MYALLKIEPMTNPKVLHVDMEKGSLENFMRVTKVAEKRGNRGKLYIFKMEEKVEN